MKKRIDLAGPIISDCNLTDSEKRGVRIALQYLDDHPEDLTPRMEITESRVTRIHNAAQGDGGFGVLRHELMSQGFEIAPDERLPVPETPGTRFIAYRPGRDCYLEDEWEFIVVGDRIAGFEHGTIFTREEFAEKFTVTDIAEDDRCQGTG